MICGNCGSTFGRKVWNSTDERLRRIIWRCNKKYEIKGKKSCNNKHVDDSTLYQAFINAFNTIIENKDYFIKKWKLEDRDVLKKYKAKQFIKIIEKAEPIQRFDVDLYFSITEKMTVYDGEKIIVSLLDGIEIECEIE